MNFAYNGTAVEVVDEESHRAKEMVKVVGEDVDRWVFVEDLDELPGGTPEGSVALDEGRTPEEVDAIRPSTAREDKYPHTERLNK